jgi:hypothetical protein
MSKVWLADPLGIGDVEPDTRMSLAWGDSIEAWQRKEYGRSFSDAVADLHIDLDRARSIFRELNVTEVQPDSPVPAEVIEPEPELEPEPIAWADFHEPAPPTSIPIGVAVVHKAKWIEPEPPMPIGVAVVRKAEWVPPPRRSHALLTETLPRRAASILEEGPAPDETMPGRALELTPRRRRYRPVIDVELPPADVEDESWWSRLRRRWAWEWREFKREIKQDLGFTDG